MELAEAFVRQETELFENSSAAAPEFLSASSEAAMLAQHILRDILQFRRVSAPSEDCGTNHCPHCASPHLAKIVSAIHKNEPITLVLPAFPGKSPNLAKVLGPLPDMAERCALEFLQHLCDRIKKHYAPGAQIILCSDGRVFSDAVGMRDEDVTAYQNEISKMIETLGLSSLSTFNLEELYAGLSFDQMRTQLMEQFGEPIENFQLAVSRGKTEDASNEDKEAHRLYCGITRFLVEDSTFPGQTKSRTALQKECRTRAYAVIQKSKAWGDLIEDEFPEAVRLSIHPQSCGAQKLGIRLIEPDNWQTPWHGVAVHVDGRFMLLKRAQAEAVGAHLVTRFGRPSHYVLSNKDGLAELLGGQYEA
jgi:L-tyrosine isonitrile synthase